MLVVLRFPLTLFPSFLIPITCLGSLIGNVAQNYVNINLFILNTKIHLCSILFKNTFLKVLVVFC